MLVFNEVKVELEHLREAEPRFLTLFLVQRTHQTGLYIPPQGSAGDAVNLAELLLVDEYVVELIRIKSHRLLNHAAYILRVEVVQHCGFGLWLFGSHNIPAIAAFEMM